MNQAEQLINKEVSEASVKANAASHYTHELSMLLNGMISDHLKDVHNADVSMAGVFTFSIIQAQKDLLMDAFVQESEKQTGHKGMTYTDEQRDAITHKLMSLKQSPLELAQSLYADYLSGYKMLLAEKTQPNKVIPK